MTFTARNQTRDRNLIDQGRIADRPWSRLRGLIGSPPLQPGEGLWIIPCNGIHMLFMSFAIDAIYLDRSLVVLGLDEGMAPWSVGRFMRGAHSVLELPIGAISRAGVQPGDQITIRTQVIDDGM